MKLTLHGSKQYLGALYNPLVVLLKALKTECDQRGEPLDLHVAHVLALEIALEAGVIKPKLYLRHPGTTTEVAKAKISSDQFIAVPVWDEISATEDDGQAVNSQEAWILSRAMSCGMMIAASDALLLLPGNQGTLTLLSLAERANVMAVRHREDGYKVKPITLFGWTEGSGGMLDVIQRLFHGTDEYTWTRAFNDRKISRDMLDILTFMTTPIVPNRPPFDAFRAARQFERQIHRGIPPHPEEGANSGIP